jgi:hypothetical protein
MFGIKKLAMLNSNSIQCTCIQLSLNSIKINSYFVAILFMLQFYIRMNEGLSLQENSKTILSS